MSVCNNVGNQRWDNLRNNTGPAGRKVRSRRNLRAQLGAGAERSTCSPRTQTLVCTWLFAGDLCILSTANYRPEGVSGTRFGRLPSAINDAQTDASYNSHLSSRPFLS